MEFDNKTSMVLTRNSILQVNATIIAGLLILLTIQSVATDSLFDLIYTKQLLTSEQKILENLQKELLDAKRIYESQNEEGEIMIETESTENEGEITFSIPLPLPLIEEAEIRIEKLDEENFLNLIKLQAKVEAYKELPLLFKLYSNPQLFVSILIIPFIVSIFAELFNWVDNKTKKDPSTLSITFLMIGLAMLILIFILSLSIYFIPT